MGSSMMIVSRSTFTKDIRLLNATVILHRHVAPFQNESSALGLDMYWPKLEE